MRIGWLADETQNPGGAELTQAEFRASAPDGVEIVDCPHDAINADCDRYVIQNCVHYTLEHLQVLTGKPVVKYWHDVGPWLQDGVREWLDANAKAVCCSPIQADYMGLEHAVCIPPPVDLERFERAAESVNGDRSGAVCIGSWRNHGKAPHKAAEWAAGNGCIDFFGGGPLAPPGSQDVPYDAMPALLASYETFVFLPTVIEPFGRLVAEAWAAGCRIVTNGLVGAKWWIENDPAALESPADNFWSVVLA
jgi:hypothetical protein